MSSACTEFRRRLEALLIRSETPPGLARPGPTPPELTTLGWHEHLYGCDACRELLQAEEALELLLSGLPDPELPRDLAQRLLRRLAPARGIGLDALLELDRAEPPPGLPVRMLAGLREARAEAQLDRLLDSLPEPAPPRDLARTVLRGLEPQRLAPHPVRRVRPARPVLFRGFDRTSAPAVLAAAAALLAVAGAYFWWPAAPERRLGSEDEGPVALLDEPRAGERAEVVPTALESGDADASVSAQPDDEFLASLELLEDWELLIGDDVDLLLATLAAPDELLLQTEDDPAVEATDGAAPTAREATEPKRG